MTVSLPTFRKQSGRFIHVPDTAVTTKAASLMEKHASTITRLRDKLGFEKDETVIAWLFEQIEMAPDLDSSIWRLLSD